VQGPDIRGAFAERRKAPRLQPTSFQGTGVRLKRRRRSHSAARPARQGIPIGACGSEQAAALLTSARDIYDR
jgi:hypothetical protein